MCLFFLSSHVHINPKYQTSNDICMIQRSLPLIPKWDQLTSPPTQKTRDKKLTVSYSELPGCRNIGHKYHGNTVLTIHIITEMKSLDISVVMKVQCTYYPKCLGYAIWKSTVRLLTITSRVAVHTYRTYLILAVCMA